MGKAESSSLWFSLSTFIAHFCLACPWGDSGGVLPWLVPHLFLFSVSNFTASFRWWPDILQMEKSLS